MHTTDMI